MKRFTGFLCIVFFFLASCSSNVQKEVLAVSEPTAMSTTVKPTELIATPTVKPVLVSTVTSEPTEPAYALQRQKIAAIMEGYNRFDEYQVSDQYWERIASGISKYGVADRILTLEYHGDDYNMYDGAYSMTTEQFEIQMRYLLENEYHFVTGPEIVGFIDGWLELPARSIILTTDSGATSKDSIPRIVALFTQLEAEYGYAPHMNSYIWTQAMTVEENSWCKNDFCWQFFRDALESGYFSFGSHTETHRDFLELTIDDVKWDLETSATEIKEAMGINVYGISWPFESCSEELALLDTLGYDYALGGWTRETVKLFAYRNDDLPYCLPRVFPPNPDGVSRRPDGKTLIEMLETAEKDVPLH